MFRSSAGRLAIQPTIETLSNDTLFARSRHRARDPDPFEVARWRAVAILIEKHAPAMRGSTKLLELDLGDGRLLRIAPDGSLSCVVDDPNVVQVTPLAPLEPEAPAEPRVDPEVEREILEEIETFQPLVEEPTMEWRPPTLRSRLIRANDLPTALRRSRSSNKARCPHCKRGLKASLNLPLHVAKGGAIRELRGKQTAFWAQLAITTEPRSFVGSLA